MYYRADVLGRRSRIPLQFSSRQIRRFQRLERVLLSPVDHEPPVDREEVEAWSLRIDHELATLLQTDKSMLILPREDCTLVSAIGMELATREALARCVAGSSAGRNRYEDPLLDRKMERLRRARLRVWNRRMSERISRIANAEIPFYQEVMRPAGLRRYDVAGVPTRFGMACLLAFHARPQENPFGESSLDLFRLLLPSFTAGLRALELHVEASGLAGVGLDRVGAGIALFGPNGAELHRNRTLCRWLDAEAGCPALPRAIEEVRRGTARAIERPGARSGAARMPGGASTRTVTGDAGRYRASGSLTSGWGGLDRTLVLITVDRLDRLLPTASELVARFGLTEREAEVALLIAEGGSNREVAGALGISRHTVRNHAQRIFDKLGIRSRKALGLFLARQVR